MQCVMAIWHVWLGLRLPSCGRSSPLLAIFRGGLGAIILYRLFLFIFCLCICRAHKVFAQAKHLAL